MTPHTSPHHIFQICARRAWLMGVVTLCACQTTAPPGESKAPSPEQVSQAQDRLATQQSQHLAKLQALQKEPLSDFIVLAQNTPLFHSEEAARAASPHPPEPSSAYTQASPEDVPAHLTTFLVLQDRGEVAEIGILPSDQIPYHCTSPLSQALLYNLEVRLWVRKDSISPVLSEPWTMTFEDKTAYSFLPGTPVQLSSTLHGDDRLHFNLSAHGFSVDAPQDEANPITLALSYDDPFARASSLRRDDLTALPPDTILWLGQKPLIRVAELHPSLRYIHQQRRFDSQSIMVALATSCVQVAAIANRADVLRASPQTTHSGDPFARSPVELERNAQRRILYWSPALSSAPQTPSSWTLWWPDNVQAGVNRFKHSPPGELDARATDDSGLNCYTVKGLNLDAPLCTQPKR